MKSCTDIHCALHKHMSTRGRTFEGIVRKIYQKTATVEWPRTKYDSKYERFERTKASVKAHAPDCMGINVGDRVTIKECRPISKTKNFVIVAKHGEARMGAEKSAEMSAKDARKKQLVVAEAGGSEK